MARSLLVRFWEWMLGFQFRVPVSSFNLWIGIPRCPLLARNHFSTETSRISPFMISFTPWIWPFKQSMSWIGNVFSNWLIPYAACTYFVFQITSNLDLNFLLPTDFVYPQSHVFPQLSLHHANHHALLQSQIYVRTDIRRYVNQCQWLHYVSSFANQCGKPDIH